MSRRPIMCTGCLKRHARTPDGLCWVCDRGLVLKTQCPMCHKVVTLVCKPIPDNKEQSNFVLNCECGHSTTITIQEEPSDQKG